MAKCHMSLLFLRILFITTTTALPPSLPPPPPLQGTQLNKIIDALIGAGDFNNWANMLSSVNPSIFPLSATLFIPPDGSLSFSGPSTTAVDPFIVPYHIVPQRLSFADLHLFKPLSRLPTLLTAKSILITNNSVSNFTVDDVVVSQPDLYLTAVVAVHGIDTTLDYSIYGDGGLSSMLPLPLPWSQGARLPPPRRPPPPQPTQEMIAPPGMFVPAGGGSGQGLRSFAACFCCQFWVVMLVVSAVFVLS